MRECTVRTSFNNRDSHSGNNTFNTQVLKQAIRDIPITWKTKHVRGHHQDQHIPIKKLDKWAVGNIECDLEAEQFWNTQYANGSRDCLSPGMMQGEGWRVCIGDRPPMNNVGMYIHEQTVSYAPMMWNCWNTKTTTNKSEAI